MKRKSGWLILKGLTVWTLAGILALPSPAQQSGQLKIEVLEGRNAIHNISRRAAELTTVRVSELSGRGVAGARVEFQLPDAGPGGRFPDGSARWVTFTDEQGQASMLGFVPNNLEGTFDVTVVARDEAREGTARFAQQNQRFNSSATAVRRQSLQPPASPGTSRKVMLILALGAAGAATGILAVRGGRSNSQAPVGPVTTGLTLGPISVGGPR